jgi:putative addiction module component (TIGR02574 family)
MNLHIRELDLAGTPEVIPVREWQKEELGRRKANLANNPASGLSWEEVMQRVRRTGNGLAPNASHGKGRI